jgi:hypothetical protein
VAAAGRSLGHGTAHERVAEFGPVAAARAEAAWLEGDRDAVNETRDTLALACERKAPWLVGELAAWRRRAGLDELCDRKLPCR